MTDKLTKEDIEKAERLLWVGQQCGCSAAVPQPLLQSLIAAARELEERRWVPVSERLPEAETEVLASTAFGERVMKGASNFRHLGVTHWMPLPKGPTT